MSERSGHERDPVKILIVDDELPMIEALRYNLCKEGYETLTASNAEGCFAMFRSYMPQLIILDIRLPTTDGYEVCQRIRADSDVPIIILTALAEKENQMKGLRSGADEYVTKPFVMRKFLTLVRGLLWRKRSLMSTPPEPLRNGELLLDPIRFEFSVQGKVIDMTEKEFELMHFFMLNPDIMISRQTLLHCVWNTFVEDDAEETVIDVFIRRLRQKIEVKSSQPRYLTTVYGKGYKLNSKPDPTAR